MFSQIFTFPTLEIKPVLVSDTTKLPVPATLSIDPVPKTPETAIVEMPTAVSEPVAEVPETPVTDIGVTKLIVIEPVAEVPAKPVTL